MNVLLVGFKPFASHDRNPSGEVLSSPKLQKHAVKLLPVSYQGVAEEMPKALENKPDLTIVMNLTPFREDIVLEQYAYNEMKSVQPDEEGVSKNGEIIVPGGTPSYVSSLDIPAVQQFLARSGINSVISLDPGRFVCNEAAYLSFHAGVPTVLVHLPLLEDMSLEEDVEAIEAIIEYFSYL